MGHTPRFSVRELRAAQLAYDLAMALRPPTEDFRRLLIELDSHLPRPLLAALLDTSLNAVRRWMWAENPKEADRKVPRWAQRSIFMLHQMVLNPTMTNLTQLAAWGRLDMPVRKSEKSSLKQTVLDVMYAVPEIPPHRLSAICCQRLETKFTEKQISKAISDLLRGGKLYRVRANPPFYALRPQARKAMEVLKGDAPHAITPFVPRGTARGRKPESAAAAPASGPASVDAPPSATPCP